MLIKEKVNQAIGILGEYGIDCWITFVRESGMMRDPMLDFLCAADMTWHSAFIISRTGKSCAIVGQMEKLTVEEMGVYDQVFGYVEGVKGDLLAYLKELDPKTIAVNYSETSEVCDGLTHGMYLTLKSHLADIGFDERLISAERVTSSLRARKTPSEIKPMRTAVENTLEIYAMLADFIRPGLTEKEIAAFTQAEIRSRGLGYAWDPFHCPAVFTGPESAGAHYQPTDRVVERGHLLNMDFGVNFEDYVSDIQRTFEIDAVARDYIVSQGYEGFPHGLGHQVGRFAHDGTALLGPAWEKYANKPFETIEEDMVFTIEPRLTVPGYGIATIEEMVQVKPGGAVFLSKPQTEIILI
jgi:Xaa-Pro aminopeptidase